MNSPKTNHHCLHPRPPAPPSRPARPPLPPPPHLARWLERPEEEFFLQGDKERDAGLPISPLFDRAKQGVSKSQVGAGGIMGRGGKGARGWAGPPGGGREGGRGRKAMQGPAT